MSCFLWIGLFRVDFYNYVIIRSHLLGLRTEKNISSFSLLQWCLIEVCDFWGRIKPKTPHYLLNRSCCVFMSVWLMQISECHCIRLQVQYESQTHFSSKTWKCSNNRCWSWRDWQTLSARLSFCGEYLQCFQGNLIELWMLYRRVWNSQLFKYTHGALSLWVWASHLTYGRKGWLK